MIKYLLLITLSMQITLLFADNVKIGILAFRSKAETIKEWTPTINYLHTIESKDTFTMIPLTYPEINNAVKNNKLDFVITNSGHYVYLESMYNISRIATMMRYKNGHWIDRFGGVIFTRADRDDIKTADDLKNKKIAAVDSESLGGYATQMYELYKYNIHANDFHLDYTGMPHANVVKEVLEGRADVGFVRTDVLEDMVNSKKINLKDLKIIHPQRIAGFPYLLSTALYPEWPIAQMSHVSKNLSNKIIVALLSHSQHKTPSEEDIGWSAPMEYRDIHEVFHTLRLPPYDKADNFTVADVYERYQIFIWITGTLSFIILIGIILEITLRRKLFVESKKNELFLRNSGDGIHILDQQGNIIQVSDQFCDMLGYKREEMIGKHVSQWDNHISIDMIHHEIDTAKHHRHIIHTKHIRKDASQYDAEVTISFIETRKGYWIYCLARDVTKELHEKIDMELAALVYKHSSDAMVISDENVKIISVNPAFETLTGYTMEEVLDHPTSVLSSKEHGNDFYHKMWESLNAGGYWEGEIIDRAKDGEFFSKWLTIQTVYDRANHPYRRIAIFSDITNHKEEKYKIWYQANFDSLTGLSNRSMFIFRLEQKLLDIEKAGQMMALLFLDLDHFKEVNDTIGHEKGDILLKEAARRISKSVHKNDVVARLGGDEFIIMLPKIDSLDDIQTVAQKLLSQLSAPFHIDHELVYISASIGITVSPEDGIKSETLLINADQAMYAAKAGGKNQYHFFTSMMQTTIQKRMKIIQELREAIDKKEFVVYYQPIVEAISKKVFKAEALVRWIKADGTIVSPADFIPIAEETELIVDIGTFVFQSVTQLLSKWRSTYEPKFQISVNKSPVQFRREYTDGNNIIDWIEKYSLNYDAIVVEITEGLLMDKSKIVLRKLDNLQNKGVALSMDDFGTGYSSLSYLKRFNIDFIKIDQSFVRNLEDEANDKAICEAITAMANKMKIKVIAEGVETQYQADYLTSIGCDYLQGYLFSKPIPAQEFEKIYLIRG